MACNVHSKKISTVFLPLGFPISSSIVFFHYKRTTSLKKFLFYLFIEWMANKGLVLVPKNPFFSINNLDSLSCWIAWFLLFFTLLLLKWENINWEFFSFKKSLSTKEQSNILESWKVYIFFKFLFDCLIQE